MLEQLNELARNRVKIMIFGPWSQWNSNENWTVELEKCDEGVELKIKKLATTLDAAVSFAYTDWYRITQHGAPTLSLNQIEYYND